MPRLDNTDDYVYLHFELTEGSDGNVVELVDLCHVCIVGWFSSGLEVEHPPYEEGDYYCKGCSRKLTWQDDNTFEKPQTEDT